MALQLFNDGLDDDPANDGSAGFNGADFTLKPSQLPTDIVRNGENIWFDVDLTAQTRPGLRYNTLCESGELTPTATHIQGIGYLDTQAIERSLAVRNGVLYDVAGHDIAATTRAWIGFLYQMAVNGTEITASTLTAPVLDANAKVRFSQLVDRMFFTDGVLRWIRYVAAAGWTYGAITKFQSPDGIVWGDDMPQWSILCSHGFRLFAVETGGNTIYVSAIGAAHAHSFWRKTDNIRVGSGEGDPIKAVLSAQAGNLIVLCASSAWTVNTSDASIANWTIQRITTLAGCVASETALSIGQDVLFLSRYGLTSLGALSANISINAANTISAPIQPFIQRINWGAINTAWATAWGDLYLLALPLDANTRPAMILPFNLRTKRWQTPWTAALGALLLGSAPGQAVLIDEDALLLVDESGNLLLDNGVAPVTPFTILDYEGLSAAAVVRFGDRQETILGESAGRLLRIDPTYDKDDYQLNQSQVIPSWLTLRAHDFSIPENNKQPFWLDVLFQSSTASGVSLNFVRDNVKVYPARPLAEAEVIEDNVATGTFGVFPIIFPLRFKPNGDYRRTFHLRALPRFRECGLQVYCPRGRLRLRSVRFAAFIDTPDLLN